MNSAGPAQTHEPGDGGRGSERVLAVAAALLLLGGGAAVTLGIVADDPPTPPPSVEASGSLRPSSSAGEDPTPRKDVTESTANGESTAARPEKIRIPAIGVTSPLTTVGLNSDGTLEVPQPGPDYDKAAWFRGSPSPGEIGPAVIEGHVDGDGGPSVFYRLGELQPADNVTVTGRDGEVTRFEVYAIRLYPKNDFPTLQVYGNTAGPELRLITCGGGFDPDRTAGGYTSNVVVYAREV